jgi:hypothetical protein
MCTVGHKLYLPPDSWRKQSTSFTGDIGMKIGNTGSQQAVTSNGLAGMLEWQQTLQKFHTAHMNANALFKRMQWHS